MGRGFSIKDVEESYRDHPVRMENLLSRIPLDKLRGRKLQVSDLAYDPTHGLTDQNHIGGAEFVLEIGRRLEISERTRVLELGSGIGGAARLLASEFGCTVTGVDVTTSRVADAKQLSKLCGLSRKNRFVRANFNSAPRGVGKRYDVLLSQNSLVHAPAPARVVGQWAQLLKNGGRIAIEEIYLRRQPLFRESRRLERLLDTWNSYLHELKVWDAALSRAGCEFETYENLTCEMRLHFETLALFAKEHGTEKNEHESYALAQRLVEDGLLGYFRVISGPRVGG